MAKRIGSLIILLICGLIISGCGRIGGHYYIDESEDKEEVISYSEYEDLELKYATLLDDYYILCEQYGELCWIDESDEFSTVYAYLNGDGETTETEAIEAFDQLLLRIRDYQEDFKERPKHST